MSNSLISDKEKFYIDLINQAYNEDVSIEVKCRELNVSYFKACEIKRKFKIPTKRFNVPNKRITKDVENQMVQMYQSGKSSGDIFELFGYKTRNTVLNVLNKYGIVRKKGISDYTNYNIDVFKKIDSHDKAYILGFIYADGYVYKNYEGIGIQITKEDRYLLERMKHIFGESSTIIDINCDKKRLVLKGAKDMVRLGVFSPKISQDLRKLGVLKNKTYVLSMPDKCVPKKYLYSFARGVIDGDGSITLDKRGFVYSRFATKSEIFAKQFNELFPGSFNCYKWREMWYLNMIGGQKSIVSFLKKMYKNKGEFYLERKYARVKDKIC